MAMYGTYPMQYPQTQYPNLNHQNISPGGITWVQGVEGAKAWQLPPNSNVLLMDSENENTFYIKSSDSVGMCNLRYFTYQEIDANPKSNIDLSQYVRRDELQDLLNNLLGGTSNEQSISTDKQTTSNKPRTITK